VRNAVYLICVLRFTDTQMNTRQSDESEAHAGGLNLLTAAVMPLGTGVGKHQCGTRLSLSCVWCGSQMNERLMLGGLDLLCISWGASISYT
jgi:hypothetical protein